MRMRWKGTSSFVHAAFVALLDHFPYAEVKARLRVIESTRQINDVIKTRPVFQGCGVIQLLQAL